MKKTNLLLGLFIFILSFVQVSVAFAHPADLYMHSIYVALTKDGMSVEWEIKPGPILISFIWFEADTNKDEAVSEEEAENWARARAYSFTAMLENTSLPLQVAGLQFPSSRNAFQSGAEYITIYLSAPWPQDRRDSYELVLHNGMEESKSLNWYYISTQNEIKFQTPSQRNSTITLQIFELSGQANVEMPLLTEWDTSMPSLPQQPQGSVTETPEQTPSSLLDFVPSTENTPQKILLALVHQEKFSIPFYIFALGISLVLGALHALTPGHGKTVVAAYLVGSRGTTWHALALGTVVTLTHTGSVFLLGMITLVASQYILPTTLIPVFEVISGLLIFGLGLYLLWQRYQYWRKRRTSGRRNTSRKVSLAPQPQAANMPSGEIRVEMPSAQPNHGHPHSHDHGDGHTHSHEVPESVTWRSLLALGVSGGLVPCPDAIAILLVAIAINRILLGLTLIVSFSLGLAVVLIVIGMLMVNSRRLFDRVGAFERFAPIMPIVSALVVLVLGIALTVGAYARVRDEFNLTGAGASFAATREAQVLYLARGQDQIKQLFMVTIEGGNPVLLNHITDNVLTYALSPDQIKVVYITQTDNLENVIWLVDIPSGERKKLSDCYQAICSRPIWSPDGTYIVYEYHRLSNDRVTAGATLWWMDLVTGDAKPVFQEQLPGANPRLSPDGKWLSYATSEGVRLYGLETGESRVIKSILAPVVDWSPDSQKVLYRDVLLRDNQFITQLFVYELASRTTTQIDPDAEYENLFAAWSPDGEWIAAIRRDLSVPAGDQIWIMRANGSETRVLTHTSNTFHNNLTWSPDGKYLLYDLYQPDLSSLESNLQMIDVESGIITDLDIQGDSPRWRLP